MVGEGAPSYTYLDGGAKVGESFLYDYGIPPWRSVLVLVQAEKKNKNGTKVKFQILPANATVAKSLRSVWTGWYDWYESED